MRPCAWRGCPNVHCLGPLPPCRRAAMWKNFLLSFVAGVAEREWVLLENKFLADSPWRAPHPGKVIFPLKAQYTIPMRHSTVGDIDIDNLVSQSIRKLGKLLPIPMGTLSERAAECFQVTNQPLARHEAACQKVENADAETTFCEMLSFFSLSSGSPL